MGWRPKSLLGSTLLFRDHPDKCSLWLRCYESPPPFPHFPPPRLSSPLPPLSREYKVPCKTLSRARTFQQLCCTKYSWRLSTSRMCLRPERIKMPGSHPPATRTPGELGLHISFQTGRDVGLSIPLFAHTTTYFVHEFYLPSQFSA